jgi:recombination associated protein RdgC
MWFKNLLVYRIPAGWTANPADIETRLARHPLQSCGGLERETHGWVAPGGDERLLRVLDGQLLIAFGTEQKLLPASVVNQTAGERADAIAAQQGYRVGGKQLREIRERVADELLPRAFVRRFTTRIWIDPLNGWLVIDAASPNKAQPLLEMLRETLPDLPVHLLRTQRSPGSAMTEWLVTGEAPAGFTIDRELELKACDEEMATVRYVRHDLEGEEIRQHIAAGKVATRLAMTWNDRISFVLTEQAQVKRLAFLDILKEEAEAQADSAEELFDIDFTLMSGELARLLADLSAALGGEVAEDASATTAPPF